MSYYTVYLEGEDAERLRELWSSRDRVRTAMELALTTNKILTGSLGQ